jgi:hypothetical protein
MICISDVVWLEIAAPIQQDQRARFRKDGILNKSLSLLEGVGLRFINLLFGGVSLVDIPFDVGRMVWAPIRIFLDGGFRKSTLDRSTKAVVAMGGKIVWTSVIYVGSVLAPELTFGVFNIHKKILRLEIMYKMQAVTYIQSTALGKIFSENESKIRADALKAAISLSEQGFQVWNFKERNFIGKALWEYVRGADSLERRISVWNEIVQTVQDASLEDRIQNILTRQMWFHKAELENEYPPANTQQSYWKAALFRTLCRDVKKDGQGQLCFRDIGLKLMLGDRELEKRLGSLYQTSGLLRDYSCSIEQYMIGLLEEKNLPDLGLGRLALMKFNEHYQEWPHVGSVCKSSRPLL